MATLSLGSGLVNKITNKVFVDGSVFGTNGTSQNGLTRIGSDPTPYIGLCGYAYIISGSYTFDPVNLTSRPTSFSLMKGVVPSAIADVSSNQRASDIIVTFTGATYSPSGLGNSNTSNFDQYYQSSTFDGTSSANGKKIAADFLTVASGGTATWSALNLSFLPRYPVASGTPTWFWLRTYGREHNIIGTVGATGSGSDLELQTYAYIDASKEYTLYNATMATFEMTQEINY